ncbi:hypothetical protein I4U23_014452 [Adineta vaga]|nr:hypothetical protein I4U23_014452 [Adineta vaga]
MPLDYISPIIEENDVSQRSRIKLKQILSDSTNVDTQTNLICHHRQRHSNNRSLQLATLCRYKKEFKRKNQLSESGPTTDRIKLETDIVDEIERYQQGSGNPHSAKLQREMYNKKQTPLICLIMDDECLSLLKSVSFEQHELLNDLLTLLNSIDDTCLCND